jgi:RNA polymerase sigma factor FliA
MLDNENEVARQHSQLVHVIASNIISTCPASVRREDLISAGYLGLLKAIRAYNPSFGTPFNKYASTRIRGEILDYLREIDPLTRHERRALKQGKITIAWCSTSEHFVDSGKLMENGLMDLKTPFANHSRREVLWHIYRAMMVLTPREKKIVKLRYWGGYKTREIADVIGVNEARISQILKKSRAKIKPYLEEMEIFECQCQTEELPPPKRKGMKE